MQRSLSRFNLNALAKQDPEIYGLIEQEFVRQQNSIELIASENVVSEAVMNAQGSVLTNKYAEGYPGKRYYGGCRYVDEVETLAINRLKAIFNCAYANVQPHSGSQANQAVYLALLQPGDKILSMSLNAGGHLTHGSKVNQSGKWFQPIHYEVNPEDGSIDYNEVEKLAVEHKPALIIAGGSVCPRFIDFKRFREIADKVGAYLLVDMAHFAGQVAAGLYENPVKYADVATSTTHKTLRGPRGGIIVSDNEELGKKINSAIFPGLQGGPLMHVIAAKAVAFGEVLQPSFKEYMKNVVVNAAVLADNLISQGYTIFTGGTDTHLLLLDLRPQGLTGADVEQSMERAGITSNKNSLPFDTQKPTVTSGVRFGSPAATSRGFGVSEFEQVGVWIGALLQEMVNNPDGLEALELEIKAEVEQLCQRFPIY